MHYNEDRRSLYVRIAKENMSIMLRPATQADQTVITRIVRAARINPTGLAWNRFLVAVEEGQIVAVGQVKPHLDGSRELASIATVPAKQGHGLAHQLIGALLARERGELYLICRTPLVGFYERFGFRRATPAELSPIFRLAQWTVRFWDGAVMKRPQPSDEPVQAIEDTRGA
jgi:N-acetylglutamate synthase-like GNAT family acetyltransferase